MPVADKSNTIKEIEEKTITSLQGVETILLVEDSEQVRNITRSMLERNGYTVITGRNATEVLEFINRYEGPIHLLLTDVVMPDMNGLEATKRICEKYQQVKVLMLSQYDDEENVHASELAGAVGFIPKKSPGAKLIAGIRSANRGGNFKHHVAV